VELRLVTSDAEAKIQFGYYSFHQRDLNRSLFNTKVHLKCYKKYQDRWYNRSIRNTKVNNVANSFEGQMIPVNDENHVSDEHLLLDVCNMDNDNDDIDYDDERDDENHDKEDDNDKKYEFLGSKTTFSNQSISQNNRPVFTNLSNIDHSLRSTISWNDTDQIFPTEDLSVHDINDENNEICNDSVLQSNINCRYDNIFSEQRKSDHEVISLENLSIDYNTNVIQPNDEYDATVTSGPVEEESSFMIGSQVSTSIDQQTSTMRSRLHPMYHTSTPKIRKRHRRQSEEGVPYSSGTNDRSLIYDSPINELHAWLKSTLRDGRLIPLIDAQHFYNQIIKSYNHHEHQLDSNIRCDSIRKQLESKFPNHYHFETVSKRDGTYIALNDISHYSRAAICLSKSSTLDLSDHQQPTTITSKSSNEDQIDECQIIFNAVRLLRSHMKESLHILETLFKQPEKMTELTNNLFADCIPLVIRNFIGFLTSSNRQFKKLEADYNYYDMFNKDLFQKSYKSLKNAAIGHDILNARHDHIVSPKHILLANEICKHGRSYELLSILNRFGHAASYKTISRIHHKIANNQAMECSLPAGVLPDC
ncbi:unnamed protein product, partial [Rotaria sp. Silwood1]